MPKRETESRLIPESGWKAVGDVHISTDDCEDHGWFLEAKGAYYRIHHQYDDTHPFYAQNSKTRETVEPRHRAGVMIRLLATKEPEWANAIRRREKRRLAAKNRRP